MNYKDWIIPELKALEAKQAAVQRIPEKIKALEIKAGAIKATSFDKDIVDGGENTREEMLLANIAERTELEKNLQATLIEIQGLQAALAELDKDERFVLDKFFIHRKYNACETCCAELNVEKSQVYRIKDKALVNIARRYYGQVKA